MNYIIISVGLLIAFGPLLLQLIFPDSMYGAYLMITFLPGMLILAIGLVRSHKSKNNKIFLQPKSKFLGKNINPGLALLFIIAGILMVNLVSNFFH